MTHPTPSPFSSLHPGGQSRQRLRLLLHTDTPGYFKFEHNEFPDDTTFRNIGFQKSMGRGRDSCEDRMVISWVWFTSFCN